MSKKRTRKTPAVVETLVEPVIVQTPVEPAPAPVEPEPVVVDAEVVEDMMRKRSVVGVAYKRRYAERAVGAGLKRKAAQRSAWDWLAQTIAAVCLDDKDRLDVDAFLTLLERNGVDHSRWTNRSKGWEGRLRMTGRLALQKRVAEAGVILLDDEETAEAPADWVAKHTH